MIGMFHCFIIEIMEATWVSEWICFLSIHCINNIFILTYMHGMMGILLFTYIY